MSAVSAKALCILLLSTLLRLQCDHHLHEIAQGVATLYPGLCAFALTARQLPVPCTSCPLYFLSPVLLKYTFKDVKMCFATLLRT